VGFRRTLDDRGRVGPGGGERPGDHVHDHAHPEAVPARLQGPDGAAADLERAGQVADQKRD